MSLLTKTKNRLAGKKVVIIMSGGNLNMVPLKKALSCWFALAMVL